MPSNADWMMYLMPSCASCIAAPPSHWFPWCLRIAITNSTPRLTRAVLNQFRVARECHSIIVVLAPTVLRSTAGRGKSHESWRLFDLEVYRCLSVQIKRFKNNRHSADEERTTTQTRGIHFWTLRILGSNERVESAKSRDADKKENSSEPGEWGLYT
jgi:hypothetical protein